MDYLGKHFNGTVHSPNLSLDEAEDDIKMVQVKSSRTLLREKYERAKDRGQVISLGATTTRTRSTSMQSTFSSISASVTAMRTKAGRSERIVTIRAKSPFIGYDATRMTLTKDGDGNTTFTSARGETSNARYVRWI